MDCILAPFVSSRRSTPNCIKLAPICWRVLMRLSLPRNLISSINVSCSPENRKGLKYIQTQPCLVSTNTANKYIICCKATSSKIVIFESVICYLAKTNISHPTEHVVLQLQTVMSNFDPQYLSVDHSQKYLCCIRKLNSC